MNPHSIIDVTVIPKSSRKAIMIDEHDSIRVYLNSPPVEGKANQECIVLFAKTLGLPKSMISIEKGLKGRKKRILINGISHEEILLILKKQK